MSHAEWKDVLNLALAVIAREPPPIPVFIYLFAALAVLLAAEGIRTVFFRPMALAAASAPPLRVSRMAKKEAPAGDAVRSQGFEARPAKFTPRASPLLARNPKRHVVELRRVSAPRPQIRRAGPLVMAIAAPQLPAIEPLEQAETAPGA